MIQYTFPPQARQNRESKGRVFCHRCWRCGQEILAELEAVEAHEELWLWDSDPGTWRIIPVSK